MLNGKRSSGKSIASKSIAVKELKTSQTEMKTGLTEVIDQVQASARLDKSEMIFSSGWQMTDNFS